MSCIVSSEEVIYEKDHPRGVCRAIHGVKGCELSFEELERRCMLKGCVLCTDKYYLMAEELQDGWYLWYAAGKGALVKFMDFMPKWLPWIGFSRVKNCKQLPPRWYLTDEWKKKIERLKE